MKYGLATEKQKTFIREYVSSGDALESARVAGYSDRSLPSLRAEASRLKRRLASQIAKAPRCFLFFFIRQNLEQSCESCL